MWSLELLLLNVTGIPPNGDVATRTDFFMEIYADNERHQTSRTNNLVGVRVTLNETFVFTDVSTSVRFEIWDDDIIHDDRLCQGFWRAIDHPHIVEALQDDHQPSRHVFKGLTGVLTCEGSPDVPLVSFDLSIWKNEPDFYLQNGNDWEGLCSTGTEQSPIFFNAGEPAVDVPYEDQVVIACNWQPRFYNDEDFVRVTAHLSPRGVTITPDLYGDFGYAMHATKRHVVKEIHFRTPAEHCFGDDIPGYHEDGVCESRRDVEMQILHRTHGPNMSRKKHAVVSLTFSENGDFEETFFWENMKPVLQLTEMTPTIKFKVDRFLIRKMMFAVEEEVDKNHPDKANWFTYFGSFSTPPCTEGIRWYNLRYPASIPPEFVKFMKTRFDGNYRNLQNNTNQHFIGKLLQYKY